MVSSVSQSLHTDSLMSFPKLHAHEPFCGLRAAQGEVGCFLYMKTEIASTVPAIMLKWSQNITDLWATPAPATWARARWPQGAANEQIRYILSVAWKEGTSISIWSSPSLSCESQVILGYIHLYSVTCCKFSWTNVEGKLWKTLSKVVFDFSKLYSFTFIKHWFLSDCTKFKATELKYSESCKRLGHISNRWPLQCVCHAWQPCKSATGYVLITAKTWAKMAEHALK